MSSVSTEQGVVVRQQAWFRSLLEVESLEPFPADQMHAVALDPTNVFRARVRVGRGPIDCELPNELFLWFENGEEEYPTFQCPSVGPRGAALKMSGRSRRLVVAADEALALIEITLVQAVPCAFRKDYENDPQGDTPDCPAWLVRRWLTDAKVRLELAVGCYALYQYPVVWEPLGVHPLIGFVDLASRALHMATPLSSDNFIPFRLNAAPRVAESALVDGALTDLARLAPHKLHFPLLLLQRALWQRNVPLRFLETFSLVEHLAAQSPAEDPSRPDRENLFAVIEAFVLASHPEHVDRIRSLKQVVLQAPLRDRLASYLGRLGIAVDGDHLRSILRIRNDLAHSRPVDDTMLAKVELQLRELAREVLRVELKTSGITFGCG